MRELKQRASRKPTSTDRRAMPARRRNEHAARTATRPATQPDDDADPGTFEEWEQEQDERDAASGREYHGDWENAAYYDPHLGSN